MLPSHLRGGGYRLAFQRISDAAYVDISARFSIGVITADQTLGIGIDIEFQPRYAFVTRASISILSPGLIVV
jgi:hypothetical protein